MAQPVAQPCQPGAPAPKKPRKRKYSNSNLTGWKTAQAGMEFLATNRTTFLHLVAEKKVRTRQLPGEKHPKYSAEDLQRIAAEAIGVAQPPRAEIA